MNALSIELEFITKPFYFPLRNESESDHFIMFDVRCSMQREKWFDDIICDSGYRKIFQINRFPEFLNSNHQNATNVKSLRKIRIYWQIQYDLCSKSKGNCLSHMEYLFSVSSCRRKKEKLWCWKIENISVLHIYF